jgi:hypothetical protein
MRCLTAGFTETFIFKSVMLHPGASCRTQVHIPNKLCRRTCDFIYCVLLIFYHVLSLTGTQHCATACVWNECVTWGWLLWVETCKNVMLKKKLVKDKAGRVRGDDKMSTWYFRGLCSTLWPYLWLCVAPHLVLWKSCKVLATWFSLCCHFTILPLTTSSSFAPLCVVREVGISQHLSAAATSFSPHGLLLLPDRGAGNIQMNF